MGTIKILPGDIIFYKPSSFIGWLVAKISKSPYSHVALVVEEGVILESNLGMKTKLTNMDDNTAVHKVFRVEGITEEQRKKVVEVAYATLDTEYDYLQVFSLFLRLVFNMNRLSFNHHNKYTCSENIDRSLYLGGVPRVDTEHLFDVTPQELFTKYKLYELV